MNAEENENISALIIMDWGIIYPVSGRQQARAPTSQSVDKPTQSMEGSVPRKPLADKGVQTSLRLPRDLYDSLGRVAGDKGIGEEIRQRLEASFVQGPAPSKDPWFSDLLTAIDQAAAGAEKLKQNPPLPAGVMERQGKREPYDVARWGQDTTAYATFVEAVELLTTALAPEGIVGVSRETQMLLASQLAALALGALGTRGLAAFTNLSEVDKEVMKLSGGAAQAMATEAEKRDTESEL